MRLDIQVKGWTSVDEESYHFRVFNQAWLQHVSTTPATCRYTLTETNEIERHGSLRPGSLRKWRARIRRKASYLEGHWCVLEDDRLKPLLSVYEIPRFFWNLAFGNLPGNRPKSVEAFQEQVVERCYGFVRADVRKLKDLLPIEGFTPVTPATNIYQQDDRSWSTISSLARQQSDSDVGHIDQDCECSATVLESRIRTQFQSLLTQFRKDLLKWQSNNDTTIFDVCVPRILAMIGTEGELPWAECQTAIEGKAGPAYLAISSQTLRGLLRSGRVMPNVPIVVRNDVTELDPTLNEHFLEMLGDYHRDGKPIQVHDFSTNFETEGAGSQHEVKSATNNEDDGLPGQISFARLKSRYQRSNDQSAFLSEGLPVNCLDFYNLGMPRSDILSGLSRFHGIQLAARRLRGLGTGKSSYFQSSKTSSILACTAFELFGLKGAYSGPHCDLYGGTYATCLSGVKAWLIFMPHTSPNTSELMDQFAYYGNSWSPSFGIFKMLILRPGDTLIMPPGVTIVHAVVTLKTSAMSGGMFIDTQQLGWHAEHVSFLINNNQATNEHISPDFPEIWEQLWNGLNEEQRTKFSSENKEKAKTSEEVFRARMLLYSKDLNAALFNLVSFKSSEVLVTHSQA